MVATMATTKSVLAKDLLNIEIKFDKDTKKYWYVLDQISFDKDFYRQKLDSFHPLLLYPNHPIVLHNEIIPVNFTGIKVEHGPDSVWYGRFENGKMVEDFLFSKSVIYNDEDNVMKKMTMPTPKESFSERVNKLANEIADKTPEFYEDLHLAILEDQPYTLDDIKVALTDVELHIEKLARTVGRAGKFVDFAGKDPEHYVKFQAMRGFLKTLNINEEKFLDINKNLYVVELLHELESLYWCQVVPKELEENKKFVSILEKNSAKLVNVLMAYEKKPTKKDVEDVSLILDELNNFYYGAKKLTQQEDEFLLWMTDTISSWVDYSRIKLLDSEYEFALLSLYTDHIDKVINDRHKIEKDAGLILKIPEFIFEDLGFLTQLDDNVSWLSKEHRNIVSKLLDKYSDYIYKFRKDYDFGFIKAFYKETMSLKEELKPNSKMQSSRDRFYALGELTELTKIEAGGYLDGILSFSEYINLCELEDELKSHLSTSFNFIKLLEKPKTYMDFKYYALATNQMLHTDRNTWKPFAIDFLVRMHTFIETEELSVLEYNNLFNLSCLIMQTIGLHEIDIDTFTAYKKADLTYVRSKNFNKNYSRERNLGPANALIPENANVYEMTPTSRKKVETFPPPRKSTFVDMLKEEPEEDDDLYYTEDDLVYYDDECGDDLVDVDVYALPSIAEQVTEVLKDEATEMAYRVAAKQLQTLVKNFLADQLSSKQKNGKKLSRDVALSFLSTELGSSVVLAAVTTLLEKHIPKKHFAGLSKELRVATLATTGNLLVDSLKTVLDKAPGLVVVPPTPSVPLEQFPLEKSPKQQQQQESLVVETATTTNNASLPG